MLAESESNINIKNNQGNCKYSDNNIMIFIEQTNGQSNHYYS